MITTTWDLPITQMMLNTMFSYIELNAAYVESIKGPNEVQNDLDTYQGLSGAPAFQTLQLTLYAMVKSDALLTNSSTNTAVLSFSNAPGQTPAGYTSPLAHTDYANSTPTDSLRSCPGRLSTPLPALPRLLLANLSF